MSKWQIVVFFWLAALVMAIANPAVSNAQMDLGPKVEKTYGAGLPRDRDRLLFADDQYPVWPLMLSKKNSTAPSRRAAKILVPR